MASEQNERAVRFAKTDLYVVITEAFCAGRSALEVLDAVLEAGVGIVQLREKDLSDQALYKRALAFRERTRQSGALLIVDDRVDIALAVDADGVHLGQTDLPIKVACALARALAPGLLIGASTHNVLEALAAQDAGASYINIGPIFATQTKTVLSGIVGTKMIAQLVPHARVPFTCMGGIKEHNIAEVVACGARHIAVVTAVTAAPDVAAAAAVLRNLILSHAVQTKRCE